MDTAQARVAAQALRAWLQPAQLAGAASAAASQAVPRWPSKHKRPCSRSPSTTRVTRRARPADHKCARVQAGGNNLGGSGTLNEQGGLRQPFSPSVDPHEEPKGKGEHIGNGCKRHERR